MFGAKLPLKRQERLFSRLLYMKLPHLAISWVDIITVILVLVGIMRGRKRGLSEELLDLFQWMVIVVGGGMFYRRLSAMIGTKEFVSQLAYSIISYILIALLVKLIFSMIKRRFGQKLVESDIFGRCEFYLGMVAGPVRFGCIYLFFLSMLHAPLYTNEYRSAKAKQDEYNYGDITFPSVMSVQDEVFKRSLTGQMAQQHLAMLLMQPASSESQKLRNDNSIAKRHEREVDAIMGGK